MSFTLQHNVIDPFQNYIREMEAIRKLQVEKGQEFIRNLQDAYTGLKKVKREYESLQSLSNEAINNHVKAQHNPATKDRELEKVGRTMIWFSDHYSSRTKCKLPLKRLVERKKPFRSAKISVTTQKKITLELSFPAYTSDVRPHHNKIRIFLFYHNRIQRDADVGYVSIHLDQVKSRKRIEEWFPIRPTSKSSAEEMGTVGSIRIAFTFREEHLLPTSQYSDFLNLVTKPDFVSLKQLGKIVVADRESLGKTAVRVLMAQGQEVEGLKRLLEADIMATDDPNIIFRGNSLTTKALDQYMKQIAMPYLHATLGNQLRAIASPRKGEDKRCEALALCVKYLELDFEKCGKLPKNLANLTEFGNKEPYMVQFNGFIQSQMSSMMGFIDRISSGEPPRNPIVPDLRVDLRRETEALYQLFSQYLGDIITSSAGGSVDELVNIMKELQVAHKRYDGDERQISEAVRALGGSVTNSPRRPNIPPPLPTRPNDTGSGPSSPPSSVYASPMVSAQPPKIELVLDDSSNSAGLQPPVSIPQGVSPSASPVPYRKNREVSIYGRMPGKKTNSFDHLEQLLNSIASGGDTAALAAKIKEELNAKPEGDTMAMLTGETSSGRSDRNRTATPISVKVSDYTDDLPASGAVSPKYGGSPRSAWSSNESLPDAVDSRMGAPLAYHAPGRPRPPPRGSSAVTEQQQPPPSKSHRDVNPPATYTPSQPRGASLFRTIVSAVGGGNNPSAQTSANSSPATSVHSVLSEGSADVDDPGHTVPHSAASDTGGITGSTPYGSVTASYAGQQVGADDDAFSDRSSVRSMESYRSDSSKNFDGGRAQGFAGRRQSLAGAASRIKNRLSMLVKPQNQGSSTGGPGKSSTSSRDRAPSPMPEEAE
ncbi:Ras GTPase-activating protein nGAP [Phlyctochytrium bullatum]|nr:Ras GTPase-activating protein nGAP [Phlyctochytrium bullatum]